MDIVIPVGPGSNPEELRYTLRSIYDNIIGVENLFLIGTAPDFIKSAFVYDFNDDPAKDRKEQNICNKIIFACSQAEISDHFIYCSDDVFTLKEVWAKNIPYYWSKNLSEILRGRPDTDNYKNTVKNTYTQLFANGYRDKNFDIHTPVIYNKEIFRSVMNEYDWTARYGYAIKSLYCNTLKIEGVELNDYKIHTPKTVEAIYRKIDKAPFFSTNEHSFNEEMIQVLQKLFTVPSKWEKS